MKKRFKRFGASSGINDKEKDDMRHTIKQQIFNLRVASYLDAFAVQQKVSDRFWMDIVPLMELQFDNASAENSTIKLDSLEINLGTISEEMIETGKWAILFHEILERSLMRTIRNAELQRGGSIDPVFENSFSQWYYFIENGYLPWNARNPSKEWYQQVLESLATNYNSATLLRKLIGEKSASLQRMVLHHPASYLTQLVRLLTAENQDTLEDATLELAAWLQSIYKKSTKTTALKGNEISSNLWKAILRVSALQKFKLTTKNIVGHLLTQFLQLSPATLAQLKRQDPEQKFPIINRIIEGIINNDKTDDLSAQLTGSSIKAPDQNTATDLKKEQKADLLKATEQLQQQVPDKPDQSAASSKKTAEGTDESNLAMEQQPGLLKPGEKLRQQVPDQPDQLPVSLTDAHDKNKENNLLAEQGAGLPEAIEKLHQQVSDKLIKEIAVKENDFNDTPVAAGEEGIFITHAGVVLLHPFLHNYFKKIELVVNGKFLSTEKQQRAICLIRYLTASITEIREYDLVLAKLLCEWPLQKPVDTDIEFKPEEKEEAHQVLLAAIEQWKILKNTSPAALRETFLQRDGKLHYKNEKWYLHVENKTPDVLLDHLPWNLSMIKLPWMKDILRVEWR